MPGHFSLNSKISSKLKPDKCVDSGLNQLTCHVTEGGGGGVVSGWVGMPWLYSGGQLPPG